MSASAAELMCLACTRRKLGKQPSKPCAVCPTLQPVALHVRVTESAASLVIQDRIEQEAARERWEKKKDAERESREAWRPGRRGRPRRDPATTQAEARRQAAADRRAAMNIPISPRSVVLEETPLEPEDLL